MPRMSLPLDEEENSHLLRLMKRDGLSSKVQALRKLIRFSQEVDWMATRGETLAYVDKDNNITRIAGVGLLLMEHDTHPNRIDEGGPV